MAAARTMAVIVPVKQLGIKMMLISKTEWVVATKAAWVVDESQERRESQNGYYMFM